MDGFVFNPKELKRIISKSQWLNCISLKEMNFFVNIKKILEFLRSEKPKLSVKLIEQINRLIFETFPRLKGYSGNEIFVRGKKVILKNDFKKSLNSLIRWFYKNKGKINPLVLSVLFHHKFEKIHPFLQGNGIIGKILMNYILFLEDYPQLIIEDKLKDEYFNCMKKADSAVKKDILNGDAGYYKPLVDFMQKQFVKTYWNNFV
jgi:fido (protein-threonine AMPylation protein)